MKMAIEILNKEYKSAKAIMEFYSPGQKESTTIHGRDQYKQSSEAVKELEAAMAILKSNKQMKLF